MATCGTTPQGLSLALPYREQRVQLFSGIGKIEAGSGVDGKATHHLDLGQCAVCASVARLI